MQGEREITSSSAPRELLGWWWQMVVARWETYNIILAWLGLGLALGGILSFFEAHHGYLQSVCVNIFKYVLHFVKIRGWLWMHIINLLLTKHFNIISKQAENSLQLRSSENCKTWIMDWNCSDTDWSWLAWMNGMDDLHRWLAWMNGTDRLTDRHC